MNYHFQDGKCRKENYYLKWFFSHFLDYCTESRQVERKRLVSLRRKILSIYKYSPFPCLFLVFGKTANSATSLSTDFQLSNRRRSHKANMLWRQTVYTPQAPKPWDSWEDHHTIWKSLSVKKSMALYTMLQFQTKWVKKIWIT